MGMQTETEVVVVGGGVAGLAAATYLARGGRKVVVLERASEPGGRARTQEREGFHFNEGPHALYRGGLAESVLRELGVPVRGGVPPTRGSLALRGGTIFKLPVGAGSLLATRLLPFAAKRQIGALLTRLSSIDPAPLAGVPLADWVNETLLHPDARALFRALVRLTTYAADDRISAGTALAQLQLASRHGVIYLDAGWQTLVDGLSASARAAGARILCGRTVSAVEPGPPHTVRLADGSTFTAPVVLVAAAPAALQTLLPHDCTIASWSDTAIPVRAACLDLALSRLPVPRHRFALGIDDAVYFSVHSLSAALAPPGGALIHVARYLRAGESGESASLEAIADLLQPGWRGALVHARFLPAMTVTPWLPTAATAGLAGRPPVAHPTLRGVFLAGDWVGSEGMLVDGALASARRAAALALESRATSAAA